MRKSNYRRLLKIAVLIVLSLVVITPASAETHFKYKVPLYDSGTYPPYSEYNQCDYPIDYVLEGTLIFHEWFDENGQLTRGNYNWAGVRNTISANGKSLQQQDSGINRLIKISETEEIVYITGHSWSATIPGQGIEFGTIGRTGLRLTYDLNTGELINVEVISRAGISYDDPTPICEYLGP